ncbi:MAG: hypothetical protein ORN24_01090, partial [Burkholderiales bacterium]|nr:hypothetical protein [Burkholderiales bacterium]
MKIYKVGGCIRDKILGIAANDDDYVVIGSTPQQMLALGFKQVGRDFPVFLHPKTHAEYALARSEKKIASGHKGFICDFNSSITLKQDLMRRDITINAIAQDVTTNQLIDPFNGVQDLKDKVIRHVSDAFTEDPLRVLRVARFAGKLNFSVAPSTLQLMKEIVNNNDLLTLSRERIWLEISKILALNSAAIAFTILNDIGAISQILPELEGLIKNKNYYLQYIAVITKLETAPDFAVAHFALLCYFIKISTNINNASNFIHHTIFNKKAIELAMLLITLVDKIRILPQLPVAEIEKLVQQVDFMRHKSRFNDMIKLLNLIAIHCTDNILIKNVI